MSACTHARQQVGRLVLFSLLLYSSKRSDNWVVFPKPQACEGYCQTSVHVWISSFMFFALQCCVTLKLAEFYLHSFYLLEFTWSKKKLVTTGWHTKSILLCQGGWSYYYSLGFLVDIRTRNHKCDGGCLIFLLVGVGGVEKYSVSSFALVAKQQPFHCKGDSAQEWHRYSKNSISFL